MRITPWHWPTASSVERTMPTKSRNASTSCASSLCLARRVRRPLYPVMHSETQTNTYALGEGPVSPASRLGAKTAPTTRRRTPLMAGVLMSLVTCLAGFNAWVYWLENRPVLDLKTVAVWMSRQQYNQAERALRERLRRSPIDGEARINLARMLAARNDLHGCA